MDKIGKDIKYPSSTTLKLNPMYKGNVLLSYPEDVFPHSNNLPEKSLLILESVVKDNIDIINGKPVSSFNIRKGEKIKVNIQLPDSMMQDLQQDTVKKLYKIILLRLLMIKEKHCGKV